MSSKGDEYSKNHAVHHREVDPDADTITQPSKEQRYERPGEAIMKSDDPSTAALREWARDKQLHIPGTDGEFVMGAISGGAGAVSGGPMFLPRKEYIVEPPRYATGHGSVELLHPEVEHEGDKEGKKKRRSFGDLFRRKSKEVVGESRDAGKDGLDEK